MNAPSHPHLRLYDTRRRCKVPFNPQRHEEVRIYTCGPTVYAPAHIGNLRSYIFPDILRRTLLGLGYKRVRQVINITDVGHLTSDADSGEDKLERAARQSQASAQDIAKKYTAGFIRDLERLQIFVPPEEDMPRATAYIKEQIALIERLESQGFTYRTSDGIYFDTQRFPRYGELARLDQGGLRLGARVEQGEKRHKTDFALWKLSVAPGKRQMEWPSPWGIGFPGWHIECSAMARALLGPAFDIHTGGTDHIPVHHTNEIAQSEAAYEEPLANYWLHGEHLRDPNAKRMGKSEGNMLTLDDLVAAYCDPAAFRYLVLTTHYRKPLYFSWEALDAARNAVDNLEKRYSKVLHEPTSPNLAVQNIDPQKLYRPMLEALCDDLNTPRALALAWEDVNEPLLYSLNMLLGLSITDKIFARAPQEFLQEASDKAHNRKEARERGDYATADRLRTEIEGLGFEVRDKEDGSYRLSPTLIHRKAQKRLRALRQGDYATADRLRTEIEEHGHYRIRDEGDSYDLFYTKKQASREHESPKAAPQKQNARTP